MNFKNVLKDWSKIEKALLFSSIIVILSVEIIFKSDILTTSCSLIGILAALLLAKGKNLGQLSGLITTILYSIVSYNNKFYGEVIIYFFLMLPMYVISIISWLKHYDQKTNTVTIKKIDKHECLLVFIVAIIMTIWTYFLLKSFNTNALIVLTISVMTSLTAVYFQIRKSRCVFYSYIVNDFVLITLWVIPLIYGDIDVILMIFNPIFNLLNDSYGVYN